MFWHLMFLFLTLSISNMKAKDLLLQIIIWQSSVKVNPHVLIGPFLVGILPYGPFLWKRS